jgi:hypothetical protein
MMISFYDEVLNALKLADKVTGEPSDGMIAEGQYAYQEAGERGEGYTACDAAQFKAMIAQAQKEIDDEN